MVRMDIIEDSLYLGGRPRNCDLPRLRKAKIKAILTVDLSPLEDAVFNSYTRLYIKLADDPSQNILSVLEEALHFIEQNMLEGAVLVHCLAGVSRSATIVIAYVMRKYRISYNEAFHRVTRMRSVWYVVFELIFSPNSGFINQLKLFESMNFTVNKDSPLYKQFANKLNCPRCNAKVGSYNWCGKSFLLRAAGR
ncbi:unnamed protein product [Schistocephalus solidus]|uniref:protein-tyrosine-phosphatase n=1 Tax=Schistocephalus solidus TaxID=70667 RepID=A0A183SZC3_SCHSO|nr:unnamed protein product [Schistocephalus solidus]